MGRPRAFTYPRSGDPEDPEQNGTEADDEDEHTRGAQFPSVDEWEPGPLDHASLAIAAPGHRDHIREHLLEIVGAVKSMESKCEELLEVFKACVRTRLHGYLQPKLPGRGATS